MVTSFYWQHTARSDIEARNAAAARCRCRSQSRKKESKADHEESVEHAALAADAPEESADTGGAAGSTDVPTHLRATMFRQRACGIKQDGSATQRDLHPHATDAIDAD